MRHRAVSIAVLSLLVVVGVAVSATQTATIGSLTGTATVMPGDKKVTEGDLLNQGDEITLPAGARMTVKFSDGAQMDVTGPANFRMQLLDDVARTIDLFYGTINRLEVKDIVMGVRTPLDSFVAAQNSTIFVGLGDTPDRSRATYMLLDGDTAKVVDGRQLEQLTKDHPIVVDRNKETTAATPGGPVGSTDFKLGTHQIHIYPPEGFEIQQLPGGGVNILRTGDGFGVVTLDGGTSFYLSKGNKVTFDGSGNVTVQDGIVHEYSRLSRQGLYHEPIPGPSSASFTGTTVK
jgi:hypothetical protein